LPAAATTSRPEARPAVASSGTGYYLQVGAFGARANAEQMRRRLRGQLAAPVTIADADSSGAGARALYRVRVGPVASRTDAERLAGELAALGVGPSLVTPR
jgi:rare lipoprotein A